MPIDRATLLFEAQDLSYSRIDTLSAGIGSPPSFSRRAKPVPNQRSGDEATSRVADFKSEWPRSNRKRWATSFGNQWPTCSGISTSDHELPTKSLKSFPGWILRV